MLSKTRGTRTTTRKRERGQALVEFCLMAPILIVLLIGLVELGNGLNSYLTVLASARDGARLGAQGAATDTEIRNLIGKETERLPTDIPTACNSSTAPGVCITHTTLSSVNTVKVEVCYNHDMIIGLPGLLPDPLLMCSRTAMRVAS